MAAGVAPTHHVSMSSRARPRSVLAATDLSRTAGLAVEWAAAVAEAAGAELHVVYALDVQPLPEGGPFLNGIFPELLVETRESLAAHLAGLRLPLEPATAEVGLPVAHRSIAERADAVAADLVVLGPHRGDGPAVLGSTADGVVRRAGCPVLVARDPPALPLARVVVPMDLSEHSLDALALALAWGEWLAPGARLCVLYVIPEVLAGGAGALDRDRLLDQLEAAARDMAAGGGGAGEIEPVVIEAASPHDGIAAFARERGRDLIIMASHGSGAVKRALVGSVASRVARRAEVPVLLVPPRGLD